MGAELIWAIHGSGGVRSGRGLIGCRIALAALSPFASAFTAAFATLTATFPWGALCTGFRAFGCQLWLAIGAAFGFDVCTFRATVPAAFANGTLLAFTTLCTVTACRTGFAFTPFDAAFRTRF